MRVRSPPSAPCLPPARGQNVVQALRRPLIARSLFDEMKTGTLVKTSCGIEPFEGPEVGLRKRVSIHEVERGLQQCLAETGSSRGWGDNKEPQMSDAIAVAGRASSVEILTINRDRADDPVADQCCPNGVAVSVEPRREFGEPGGDDRLEGVPKTADFTLMTCVHLDTATDQAWAPAGHHVSC